MEEVTACIDEVSPVDVLYLDFSTVFDKVPHKRLVKKVKAHGVGSTVTSGDGLVEIQAASCDTLACIRIDNPFKYQIHINL